MVGVEFVLYAGSLLLTAAFGIGLVLWVRADRQSTAVDWFVFTNLAAVLWALTSLGEAVAGRLGLADWAVITLFELQYAPRTAVPIGWFVFSLYFTGWTDVFTRRVRVGLAASFVASVGLALTNRLHGLMFSSYDVVETPFRHVAATRTGVNWATLSLSALITLAGVFVLGRFAVFSRRVSRRQLAAILLTPVPAWLLHLGGRLGVVASDLEYGAIGTATAMALAAWALFREDLFAVEPVARDTVVSNVRDGIVTVDRNGRVVDFNDAALEVYPELTDAVGRPLETAAPNLIADTRTDGGDGTARFVDEVVNVSDGQRTIHNVVASPVTVDGELRGYTLTLRDVTAVREREEQLEQETRQLDEFVSTVSHDLRNPLTVARGYVETARADSDDEALAEAEASLDRMEQMIDDALALAREGRAISDREFVSLADVARAAWRTSDTRAGTLDVCVGDGVRVYADDDRLRRLFENLFRNAVDHGPDDVTVRVDAGESSFHVEDTGPGVPSDQRDRVFERGFTTDADGTGLGLAVVETIAEAHGWQASVETGEQGGARFVFDDVELRSTGADWLTDAAGDDTRDRR